MKTEKEIRNRIKEIEKVYQPILTGSLATIAINAPRALSQLSIISELTALNWCLGETYKSKLKGRDL